MAKIRRPSGGLLGSEIRQRRAFGSLEEAAFLNLQRTASLLMQSFAQLLKAHVDGGLTAAQYNVLRILRGAHPDALSCGEISERMVTADPDVTRLVDRLVRRQLATRTRDAHDRRVVKVTIHASGLELLSRLDGVVVGWLQGRLGHLPGEELEQLIRLLETARAATDEDARG